MQQIVIGSETNSMMTRFDILKQAKVIDDKVYRIIESVQQKFILWGINCTESQVEMLLTHLAMALMRIQQGEIELAGLDQESWQEITGSENFSDIVLVNQVLLELVQCELPGLVIPDIENQYFLANLYGLSLNPKICFNLNIQKNEDLDYVY